MVLCVLTVRSFNSILVLLLLGAATFQYQSVCHAQVALPGLNVPGFMVFINDGSLVCERLLELCNTIVCPAGYKLVFVCSSSNSPDTQQVANLINTTAAYILGAAPAYCGCVNTTTTSSSECNTGLVSLRIPVFPCTFNIVLTATYNTLPFYYYVQRCIIYACPQGKICSNRTFEAMRGVGMVVVDQVQSVWGDYVAAIAVPNSPTFTINQSSVIPYSQSGAPFGTLSLLSLDYVGLLSPCVYRVEVLRGIFVGAAASSAFTYNSTSQATIAAPCTLGLVMAVVLFFVNLHVFLV